MRTRPRSDQTPMETSDHAPVALGIAITQSEIGEDADHAGLAHGRPLTSGRAQIVDA